MPSSRKKQQGEARKATSPRQNPGLKESKTAKRNRQRSAKVDDKNTSSSSSSSVKVIPLPEAGKWTSNDLCDIINLPEAGTTAHRARDDINYLFSTEDSDLVPYELLQKEELQMLLDLLNDKITTEAYYEWHEQWRIRMKEQQDMGGKYVTNLSKTALVPCTGMWLTYYATEKEKDYECPHEVVNCNRIDPANPSMRTLLLDQPRMIYKEATGDWLEDLTVDSPDIAGIKPVDLVPINCDIRKQDEFVDKLANDQRVTSSRIRTTGVILALSTIVYHYATTGEALPIMYASVTGAEEQMVFGCSSEQAKKKGISCEPFKNRLVVCHGCRPHPENDVRGERNLRNSCYTMEWHEKTGVWIMNFYHAASRGDFQRRLLSLLCTKYLLKRAKLLGKSPEEIAAINETQRAGRVAGGEAVGEQNTMASALRKVDDDEEELDEEMQVLLKKLIAKFGKEALDEKMKRRMNEYSVRSLASAMRRGPLSSEMLKLQSELETVYITKGLADRLKRINAVWDKDIDLKRYASAVNSGEPLSTEMLKLQAELEALYGGKKALDAKIKRRLDGWDKDTDLKRYACAINSGEPLSTEMLKLQAELETLYGGKKELEDKVKSRLAGWNSQKDTMARRGAQQVHQRNVTELNMLEAQPEEKVTQKCPVCGTEKETTHIFVDDEGERKIVLDTCNSRKSKPQCNRVMRVKPSKNKPPSTISRRSIIRKSKDAVESSSDEPSSSGGKACRNQQLDLLEAGMKGQKTVYRASCNKCAKDGEETIKFVNSTTPNVRCHGDCPSDCHRDWTVDEEPLSPDECKRIHAEMKQSTSTTHVVSSCGESNSSDMMSNSMVEEYEPSLMTLSSLEKMSECMKQTDMSRQQLMEMQGIQVNDDMGSERAFFLSYIQREITAATQTDLSQWLQPPDDLHYYGSVSEDAPYWVQDLHYINNGSYYQHNNYNYNLVSSRSNKRQRLASGESDDDELTSSIPLVTDDDTNLSSSMNIGELTSDNDTDDEANTKYEESVKRGLGLMRPMPKIRSSTQRRRSQTQATVASQQQAPKGFHIAPCFCGNAGCQHCYDYQEQFRSKENPRKMIGGWTDTR